MRFHLWFLENVEDGQNTVSESTVSNTELGEFSCPRRVPGRELSELLSAHYLCGKVKSTSASQNSPSVPNNSVSSLFRNSTLEAVLCPFRKFKMVPKVQVSGLVLAPLCKKLWTSLCRQCRLF